MTTFDPAVSAELSQETARRRVLVVTPCSAGKRCRSPISAAELPRGPQSAVAAGWLTRLRQERALTRADHLYKGRAFTTARAAAAAARADFGVVSAGLGYVRGETLVPGYDLTVREEGPASVRARIDGAFDAQAWWCSVASGPYAADFAAACADRDLVLIALSRPYLQMLAGALKAVAAANPSALRLFGLSLETAAPADLRPFVMPYDSRLERLGAPGTRSDFAPRALAHFVDRVLPVASGLEAQREAVLGELGRAPAAAPARPQRRGDDATLKALIRQIAPKQGFRSTAVLQALRRDEGWSCEQGRFSALFREVQAEREIAR